MQEEVEKWMVGLGFKWKQLGYIRKHYWISIQEPSLHFSCEQATFFYQATQREVVEARIDEVKRSLYRGYYIPEMEVQAEDRINQLEQQRQKLREKRS
jgi:hypothetical protein